MRRPQQLCEPGESARELLTFEASGPHREIARLGSVMVAEVENGLGTGAWCFARIYLPEVSTRPRPARSLEHARQIVRDRVRDWLDAAGLATEAP